jgi:chromatin assembly factor 1 subunit A
MSNFFAKPKAGPSTARARSSSPVVSRRSPSEAQAKEVETEYSKTFRPFVIKKGADVAPINWFLDKGRSKGKAKEVIDLVADDDDDVVLVQEKVPATDDSQTQDLANLSDRGERFKRTGLSSDADSKESERLQQLLALMPPALAGSSHQTSGDSVRSIISLMSDAEVNGDIALVRMYHDRLADRTALPAKVFIFAEDTRPGYFGTHTKTSTIIKPRAPLNRDTAILDYTYDSDEEWEGEEEGGGDDVADDDEEGGDAAANDDDDSDADSWLVDDDDVDNATLPDLDRMSPVSDISLGGMSIDRARSPVLSRGRSPVLTLKKRKSMTTEEKPKGEKKRRVVVPLVPYIKGPHWESEVGTCEYAPFESFRIQLFNG